MFAEYGVLSYWTHLVGTISIMSVPGPSTIFVLKNSVGREVKGGYLTTSGVLIGDTVLMFLAYTNVTALIRTTFVLFNIVRYLGALYLLYLGMKTLYATLKLKASSTASKEVPFGAILKRALILNLTNPRTILFYVSFFVQLIDVNVPHSGLSFFILTIIFEAVSFFYLGFLILSGAFMTQCIHTKKKLTKVGNSLVGSIFVGLAARLTILQL